MLNKDLGKRVIIKKPESDAGKVGVVEGDRFKWPGQSFWVTPILLDNGSRALALSYEEHMEGKNVDLPLKINPEPSLVYNYQDCLKRGVCVHCGKSLKWELEVKKNDDRFCSAVCCTTRYSMVPEQVRILASFALPPGDDSDEDTALMDDDFLRELQNMNLERVHGVAKVYEDDDTQ